MIRPRHEPIPGENRVPEIIWGIGAPFALATLFVAGRIFARVRVLKIWNWDDTLIIIAWLDALALTVLFGMSTHYGQGHHMQDVPPKLMHVSSSLIYISFICYQVILSFTKFSILVFYIRAFPGRRERLASWVTIAVVVGYTVPLLVGDVLQCEPLTGANFYGGPFCFESRKIINASTVCHTVTDAWMILMIIPVVWSLQIPPRQKWTLIGIMSLGVFVIGASIARTSSISRYPSNSPDRTWLIVDFYIWTAVECSVGIVCACAPTLRPVLCRIFPVFLASQSGGSAKSARYGRRSTGERRMAGAGPGAIELCSDDPPPLTPPDDVSREGPWREMDPAGDRASGEGKTPPPPLASYAHIHKVHWSRSSLDKSPPDTWEPGRAM